MLERITKASLILLTFLLHCSTTRILMPNDPECVEEVCMPRSNLIIAITELPAQTQRLTIGLLSPREEDEECRLEPSAHPPAYCQYHVSPLATEFRFIIHSPTIPIVYTSSNSCHRPFEGMRCIGSLAEATCAIPPERILVMRWLEPLCVTTEIDRRDRFCVYVARRRQITDRRQPLTNPPITAKQLATNGLR